MKINSISHSVISQSEKRKKLQRYSKYLLIQSLNVWFCMVCYSELTSSLLSVSCCLFTGITTLTFSLDCKQIKTKSLLDAITSIFYCTLLLTQLPSIWCSCLISYDLLNLVHSLSTSHIFLKNSHVFSRVAILSMSIFAVT